MLTDADRKKLSDVARGLAAECEDGTAPMFGKGSIKDEAGGPCCVLGHLLHRAGFDLIQVAAQMRNMDGIYWQLPIPERSRLWVANDLHPQSERHHSVRPHLIALADALDEPRAAPSPTPNTRKER